MEVVQGKMSEKSVLIQNQVFAGGFQCFFLVAKDFINSPCRATTICHSSIEENTSTTAILLHDNLLSCCVPGCGNTTASTSIIAIGNRLGHPKGEFPAWVSKYERDPLFWDSGVEGLSLLRKISGAVLFLVLVLACKRNNARWLKAMSRWQTRPVAHLRIASSLLVSCLVKEFLLAAVFLMCLLYWDLYACPETLAIASACLRSA